MGGSYLDGPYYSSHQRFAWPEFIGGLFCGMILTCTLMLAAERWLQ